MQRLYLKQVQTTYQYVGSRLVAFTSNIASGKSLVASI